MSIALATAIATRDIEMELRIIKGLSKIIPDEGMGDAQVTVHKAIAEARESWEHQLLNELYDPKTAALIRKQWETIKLG